MRGLNLSQTISTVGLLSAFILGITPAASVARDKKEPEPKPCPVDTNIVSASSEITKRFSTLAQCQVIETPATPSMFELQAPVVISSDSEDSPDGLIADANNSGSYDASRNRNGYAATTTRDKHAVIVEEAEQAGVRYTRIIPPEQPSESYFGATPYGVPNAPIYAPLPVTSPGAGSGMTIAAFGASTVGQSAPTTNTANLNDAAILKLRPRSYASRYDDMIEDAARRHGVDPLMLHAVIFQESRYKQNAQSHVGARGLMQIMPGTGVALGVRNSGHLFDPATNIDAGAKLLRQLWTKFNGRFDLVLAAYNAGPGAVTKYGFKVPPYRETRDYVVKVQGHYKKLAAENGMTPSGF